jgi:hypothetical protein
MADKTIYGEYTDLGGNNHLVTYTTFFHPLANEHLRGLFLAVLVCQKHFPRRQVIRYNSRLTSYLRCL